MALGALIGAYQEDDAGGLRALLPLAGRTLIEYQARCLAASGAAPLVVLVERVPVALNDAFERLRAEGIAVVAVSGGDEAASRFEAGSQLILLGDGVAPDMGDLERLIGESDGAHPDGARRRGARRIRADRRAAALGGAGAGRFRHARRHCRDGRGLGPAVDFAQARHSVRCAVRSVGGGRHSWAVPGYQRGGRFRL